MIENDFIKNKGMNVRLIWVNANPNCGMEERVIMESNSELGLKTFLMELSPKEAEILTGLKEKDFKEKTVTATLKCKVNDISKTTKKQKSLYSR